MDTADELQSEHNCYHNLLFFLLNESRLTAHSRRRGMEESDKSSGWTIIHARIAKAGTSRIDVLTEPQIQHTQQVNLVGNSNVLDGQSKLIFCFL